MRATDRAGNTARARVTFNVVAVPDPGQPDDQPGGDREALRQQILQVLEKWEGKIHQGQLQALKAKLMNGNWVSFVHQVQKFSGKFIHPEAAKELLALFDSDDLDDWTGPWGNAGPIGRNEGWKDGWKKGWGDARDDDDDDDWNDDWDDDWDDDDDDDDDDSVPPQARQGQEPEGPQRQQVEVAVPLRTAPLQRKSPPQRRWRVFRGYPCPV